MISDQALTIVIKAVDNASSVIRGVEKQVSMSTAKFRNASDASTDFAKGLAGVGVAMGGVGFMALKAASTMEQTRISFDTFLGSAEAGRKTLGELYAFAKNTPFTIVGIEDAAKRLLAYGTAQKDLIPTLTTLGDLAAGVGTDKFPQLVYAYGQVAAAGKLYGTELRQFTETGIPLIDALADHFGVASGDIRNMVEDGVVGFDDLKAALGNLRGEGGLFENLMEKQSKSLGGMVSNLQDSWNLFLRGEGAALLDWAKEFVRGTQYIVTDVLPNLITKIKELTDFFREHQTVLVFVVGAILGALIPAFVALAIAIGGLVIALAPFALAGGALAMMVIGIKELDPAMTGLAAGIMVLFIPALTALKTSIMTTAIPAIVAFAVAWAPFLIAGAVIAGVVAGIVWLIKNWDMVSAKVAQVWGSIMAVIGGAADWIVAKLTGFGEGMLTVMKNTLAFVVGAVMLFLDWLVPGWDVALLKLYDLWMSGWNKIKAFLDAAFTAIQAKFTEYLSKIKTVWGEAWEGMSSFFMGLWDPIKEKFRVVFDYIIEKINAAIKLYNKLKDMIGAPVKKATTSIGSTVQDFVNKALGKGNDALGFEHGGLINAPRGTAVPIIAHGQERIVPAGSSGSGSGNTYQFNVNILNPVVPNTAAANSLRKEIDLALRDLVRTHKLTTV